MDSPNLLTRVVAAGLPLLVIALVFGGAGYALTDPGREPVPQLPPAEDRPGGARGIIQSVTGSEITLVTQDGASLKYRLASDASVEVLRRATINDVAPGDWLNGGAIPHAQTLFALVGLVLIPDPVVSP